MFKYLDFKNLFSLYFAKASQPIFIIICIFLFQSDFNNFAKNIIGGTFFSGILLSLSQPVLVTIFESKFNHYKNIIFNINFLALLFITFLYILSDSVDLTVMILSLYLFIKGTNDYWVAKEDFIILRAVYSIPFEIFRYVLLLIYFDISLLLFLFCMPLFGDLVLHILKNKEKKISFQAFNQISLSLTSFNNVFLNQIKNLEGLTIYMLSIAYNDFASILLLGQQVVGVIIVFFQTQWFKILSKIENLNSALNEYLSRTKFLRYCFLIINISFILIFYLMNIDDVYMVLLVALTLLSLRTHIIDPLMFLTSKDFRLNGIVIYFLIFISTLTFIYVLKLNLLMTLIYLSIIINLVLTSLENTK